MHSKKKLVIGSLVGVNGNAFALMGHFRKLAMKQGWTKAEINKVLTEAMSGDYNHLLQTLDSNMED
jgi:hypothetical protein